MRVVIVGASGNAGTSLIGALAAEERVDSILGIARRRPRGEFPKTAWVEADIAGDDLTGHFQGADAVVHLAWLIQPSHDEATLRAVNVNGSNRVFEATARAGVENLIYASSVGAYAPGPKDRFVDESWPTTGIETSFYSRHKVEVERLLDRFEERYPDTRVVRMRPALIFKREAGAGVRRLFAGPLLPKPLLRRGLIPVFPQIKGLAVQAVHSYDVGEAYRLAIVGDARGPFNLAAEPVLDSKRLARLLGARPIPTPAGFLRGAAAATWRAHLQPTPPGWLDMGLQVPLLSSRRAREELGWHPRYTGEEAFLEVFEGVREGAGLPTPPLEPDSESSTADELLTGVGSRNP